MPDEPVTEGVDAEASAEPPLRRSRLGLALVVSAAVLLLGAAALLVLGLSARSNASTARIEAKQARAERVSVLARDDALEKRRVQVAQLDNVVPNAVGVIASTLMDVVKAHNDFVGVITKAYQHDSTGDRAGGAAIFQTDGAAAIDQLQQKVATLHQALTDEQPALQNPRSTK